MIKARSDEALAFANKRMNEIDASGQDPRDALYDTLIKQANLWQKNDMLETDLAESREKSQYWREKASIYS